MRAEPKLPEASVNVTKRHPLKEASTLIIGLAFALTVIFTLGAIFIERATPLIPLKTEARAFNSLWNELEDDAFGLGVVKESAELKRLVDSLASHWKENPYDFKVGILEDSTPNALALPGGVILVTRGLLGSMESENELAFVLGHEIGHFRNRDHLKGLGRTALFRLMTGLVDGNQIAQLTQSLSDKRFSRMDEVKADSFGLELLKSEYGHVSGSTDFFSKLSAEESKLDKTFARYTGAHPASDMRVEALKTYAARQHWSMNEALLPSVKFD